MSKSIVRRWLVAVWTACAALGAGGAPYYVIDLSGGANASYYPLEILDGEPAAGWTDDPPPDRAGHVHDVQSRAGDAHAPVLHRRV